MSKSGSHNVTRRGAIVIGAGLFGLGVAGFVASNFLGKEKMSRPVPTQHPHVTNPDESIMPHGGVRSYLADFCGISPGLVAPAASVGTDAPQ